MGLLSKLANAVTEGVKVKAVTRELRGGCAVWIKRRRRTAGPILLGANAFFSLAGAPVRALRALPAWQAWEVSSFETLHGQEGFRAVGNDQRSVAIDELPGVNLTGFLDGGTMIPQLAAAAGRELRRAHAQPSAEQGGLWSHGDTHAGNFMYDAAADRARLIDFEVRHLEGLSQEERQGDDVLGFLLDMVGRIEAERWLPCARGFLEGYGEVPAGLLASGGDVPAGLAGIWLRVRTTFLPKAEFRRRWDELLKALN